MGTSHHSATAQRQANMGAASRGLYAFTRTIGVSEMLLLREDVGSWVELVNGGYYEI